MKKLFTIITVLLVAVTAGAQEYTLTDGAYDNKVVEQYEGADAATLYVRALEMLSDWAGSQAQSKVNIDVQDKQQGLVVYKGTLFIGFHKANMLCGWNVYADFTLKIKCKDGRAQISCHVPSATFEWTGDPATLTVPLANLYPEYNFKTQYRIKKSAAEWVPQIPPTFNKILSDLAQKMKTQNQDDDF